MLKPSAFAELSKLCRRSFPERLDQRISQAEAVPDARHPALAFALSWREGRRPRLERLIVRRYADPWTWWSTDDRQKARREWEVLRWLYGHGLPVPAPYAWGAGEGGFVLLARMPGRDGTSLAGQGVQTGAPYLDALARTLAQLHRLTPASAVSGVLPLVAARDELARLGQLADQASDGSLRQAVAGLAALWAAANVEEGPPCVLHGDPHLSNALFDARGITALQGWENGALGDPRWDLARAVNGLQEHGAGDVADRFCAVYAGQTGQLPSAMAFWTTLAAIQSWALAAWVCAGVCGRTGGEGIAASPAADAWIADLTTWREQAWRGLTRLHHEQEELSAPSEHLSANDGL